MEKIVAGLFERFEDGREAVRALEASGFSPDSISIIGPEGAREGGAGSGGIGEPDPAVAVLKGAGGGAAFGAVSGVLAGLATLVIPGVGPVTGAGWLMAALASGGVGAGMGAIIGELIGTGILIEHAEYYQEAVKRGGTLVVLRTQEARTQEAALILHRNGAVRMDERSSQWREGGMAASAGNVGAGRQAGAEAEKELNPEAGAQPPGRRRGFETYEPEFRQRHAAAFGSSGYSYEEAAPLYRDACETAADPQQAELSWEAAEGDLRERWERAHPGSWDRVRACAQTAWNRARQKA